MSGITIRGSSHWTIVPRDSRHVTIRNVKLCNSRVQNDDGINPCNSQDVLITDCFIRSDDDCVALKGLDFTRAEQQRRADHGGELRSSGATGPASSCSGHESRAAFMRNITLRNLDIIHFTMTPFLLEPGEDMRLEDVTVEDIRIHGEGQSEFIRLQAGREPVHAQEGARLHPQRAFQERDVWRASPASTWCRSRARTPSTTCAT